MKSASAKDFGTIELKVLKLVVSYCCYFMKGYPTPSSEYRESSKQGYYSLAIKIAHEGKLRLIEPKLSSIVKDRIMSDIIQAME
ncbi:hypothetical protein [Microseira wollei]|uniref:hypothetical protein n=1 Tax=Microseira wollei TaxID=467598 RepID=UPI001CFCBC7C|nr:hypothetical protein [Microseira wollei]